MGGAGDSKLAAKRGGRHAGVVIGIVFELREIRIGNGAQKITHQVIEFRVSNKVSGLLTQKRTAEDARQAEQRATSAGEAGGAAVARDQLTLDAECCGLQRDKINVLKRVTINCLTKHACEGPHDLWRTR